MIKTFNLNADEQKRVASISNELARASFILNPREFKVFLNAVSLIKPDGDAIDENFFTYKEIDMLVGTPESKRSITALRKLLASTIKNLVYFDKDRANGYTLMTSYASKDTSKIRLKINEELKEHFLLVENVLLKEQNGSTKTIQNVKKYYTKIDMKYFNKLSSKYSMRLYILIKSFQTRYITDDFSLDDFKYFFALEKDISDVKVFNKNILKKSIAEINDKTDIIVTPNPIKQCGKTIVGYSFKIKSKTQLKSEECGSEGNSDNNKSADEATYEDDNVNEKGKAIEANESFDCSMESKDCDANDNQDKEEKKDDVEDVSLKQEPNEEGIENKNVEAFVNVVKRCLNIDRETTIAVLRLTNWDDKTAYKILELQSKSMK